MQELYDKAIAPSTQQAYATGFRLFRHFLTMHGEASGLQLPPINEQVLVSFVAFCHKMRGLSHGTIKLYLCGIRYSYVRQGLPNPLCDSAGNLLPSLATVLRAVKKSVKTPGNPRLPITFDVLLRIVQVLRSGIFTPFINSMLEAACVTAFFAFLRCGEFTVRSAFCPNVNLSVSSVVLDPSTSSASITIPSSKTDPCRQGVCLRLFCTERMVCPVHALASYLNYRVIKTTAAKEPLFLEDGGKPLSRTFFIAKLKFLLLKLGLNQELYNGHSFRIGAATSAAKARVEDHLIQTLGRWASNCYMRYIRTDADVLRRAQCSMCAGSPAPIRSNVYLPESTACRPRVSTA